MFDLDAAGTEIAAIGAVPQLADHRQTLAGAFELADADVTRAIEAFTDGALTLGNLSELYRHVLLARGLGLTIAELSSLLNLVEQETAAAPFFELVSVSVLIAVRLDAQSMGGRPARVIRTIVRRCSFRRPPHGILAPSRYPRAASRAARRERSEGAVRSANPITYSTPSGTGRCRRASSMRLRAP